MIVYYYDSSQLHRGKGTQSRENHRRTGSTMNRPRVLIFLHPSKLRVSLTVYVALSSAKTRQLKCRLIYWWREGINARVQIDRVDPVVVARLHRGDRSVTTFPNLWSVHKDYRSHHAER